MTDKKKTMKELLQQVAENHSQKIEEETPMSRKLNIDMDPLKQSGSTPRGETTTKPSTRKPSLRSDTGQYRKEGPWDRAAARGASSTPKAAAPAATTEVPQKPGFNPRSFLPPPKPSIAQTIASGARAVPGALARAAGGPVGAVLTSSTPVANAELRPDVANAQKERLNRLRQQDWERENAPATERANQNLRGAQDETPRDVPDRSLGPINPSLQRRAEGAKSARAAAIGRERDRADQEDGANMRAAAPPPSGGFNTVRSGTGPTEIPSGAAAARPASAPPAAPRAAGFGLSGAQSTSGPVAKATPLAKPEPAKPAAPSAPARPEKFKGTAQEFMKQNPGATYGQALNAIRGLTARAGQANDPEVIAAQRERDKEKGPVQPVYVAKSGTTMSDQETTRRNVAAAQQDLEQGREMRNAANKSAADAIVKRAEQGDDSISGGQTPEEKKEKKPTNEGTKMSSSLIEAFLKLNAKPTTNLFVEAKKHKKLDPVGKEDGDIDNDGDTDKSDQYLHNRRKAIAAAVKEAKEEGEETREGGAVTRNGKPVVSPTAPGGSGYKKEGPSDKEREALTNKIKDIQKEEVEQIDELKGIKEPGKKDEYVKKAKASVGGKILKAGLKKMVGMGGPSDDDMDTIQKRVTGIARAGDRETAAGLAHMTGSSMPRSSKKKMKEDVEQIDELSNKTLKSYTRKAETQAKKSGKIIFNPNHPVYKAAEKGKPEAEEKYSQASLTYNKRTAGIEKASKKMKEDVDFSEAELAHFASIMEISVPASPVADDYTGSNHGVSKRDLSDETIVETKKKDPSELKKRGRKAGVKVGSYKMKGMDDVEGEEHKAEPKNLVAQNPRTYNKEGKNMVDLEHPSKPGVKRTVPAKEYNSFRSSYLNAEKPEHKTRMHDDYVKRVFN